MKYEPLASIRHKDGFTSSTYLNDHILTSSMTGKICQWDSESGNLLSQFNCTHGIRYCLPLHTDDEHRYRKLVLQTLDNISVFDTNTQSLSSIAKINAKCFARCSLLTSGPSRDTLLISPVELNTIKVFDPRFNTESPNSKETLEIPPFKIQDSLKSEIGMIHHCQPFKALGDSCIVSTYESGSILVYDLRKSNQPLISPYILDSREPIPALSVWRNVLIVGDTTGNIWMLHGSSDKGIVLIKKGCLSTDSANPVGISCMDTRNDGAVLVAGCWDRCVRLLETKTLELKVILENHCSSIVDVSFGPESKKFCTTSGDGNSNVWDLFSNAV